MKFLINNQILKSSNKGGSTMFSLTDILKATSYLIKKNNKQS